MLRCYRTPPERTDLWISKDAAVKKNFVFSVRLIE